MKRFLFLLSLMFLLSFVSLHCETPQKPQKPVTLPEEPTKTITLTGQKPIFSQFIQVSGTAVKEPRATNPLDN
jgi:hypothetical protein